MLVIQIASIASQTLVVQTPNQLLSLALYQKTTGLYVDIEIADATILTGVLGRDRVYMVRNAYLGLVGDLSFLDSQGASDPTYDGLGTRYKLFWFSPDDLAGVSIT